MYEFYLASVFWYYSHLFLLHTDSRSWRAKYWEWPMSFRPWKTRSKRTARRSKWTKPYHILSPTLLRWERRTLPQQCEKCAQCISGGRRAGGRIGNLRRGIFSNYWCSGSQDFQVFLLVLFVTWKRKSLARFLSGSFLGCWLLFFCT